MGSSQSQPQDQAEHYSVNTKSIFVGSKLLSSPLEAMYGLLAFILCKELNASPLQITLLISAKPIMALFSFYGNLLLNGQPHRLKTLIRCCTLISFLPALLFPFISHIWFFILGFAVFMMANRAIIPAWSEIMRINLSDETRGKIFSRGSTANYLTTILIPILVSPWIDYYPDSWRLLFFIVGAIQSINLILISFIQIKDKPNSPDSSQTYNLRSLKSILLDPWKNSLTLIKNHTDFKNFQLVFMLGGGGLILMQPAFPLFFKQTLQLSYTELTFATSFCKGLSFALSSPFWAKKLHQVSLHLFNSFVTLFAALFAFCLLGSAYYAYAIYAAYILYGVMQAGSELSWNLSGPIFSKEKDSTLFTGVNIAMVGLRGCFMPFLGEALFLLSNAETVFTCGGCLCLMAAMFSAWLYQSAKKTTVYT